MTTRRTEVADFRDCPRDRFIDTDSGPGVRLTPSFLLTNEPGVARDLFDELDQSTNAKVEFELYSDRVRGAQLLFYVNDNATTQTQPMSIHVNGAQPLSHTQDPERMLTGGWDRADIPAAMLVPGGNELVFGGSGILYIDPLPDGKSSRSFDSGGTWHTGSLGAGRDIEGEYMVRLRVHGHPPRGTVTSNVIDLADVDGEGVVAAAATISVVNLASEQELPDGTAVSFELRSGSRPRFDPTCWTPWSESTQLRQPGRYLQWRATLTTTEADRTPVITSMILEADVDEDCGALHRIELLELDHPKLVRSSYYFTNMAPEPRVERFAYECRLEQVIASADSELEQFALLRDWTQRQWYKGAARGPYLPTWNPREILDVTKGNWGNAFCSHYGALFCGAAAALGFTARNVIVDHHTLAEIWSDDLQKWILQDPYCYYNATYELDGEMLNALDIHQAVARGDGEHIQMRNFAGKLEPIKPNLPEIFCRFAIPPRNNYLVQDEPAEIGQGATQYHYDGYIWWTEDIDPKYPEYSLQTTREGDLYWSVNQTRIYLQATGVGDELLVDFDHATPNFSHFVVCFDDAETWERRQAPLSWPLHWGRNRLAVRSVNAFGRQGAIARAAVQVEDS
jgi:hypothetical protein